MKAINSTKRFIQSAFRAHAERQLEQCLQASHECREELLVIAWGQWRDPQDPDLSSRYRALRARELGVERDLRYWLAAQ